jgi:hypothetical protein
MIMGTLHTDNVSRSSGPSQIRTGDPRHVKALYVRGVTTGCNRDGGKLGRRFEPAPATLSQQHEEDDNGLWSRFEEYLLVHQNPHTAGYTLRYARRYAYILEQSNAQDLLSLQNEKRTHVMKALANLSKFLGCYHRWKEIRERYQLKWSK